VDHAVLWEFDPAAYKFAFVSQRSLDIFGYTPVEWKKDPQFFLDRIDPEDLTLFKEMLDAAIKQGKDGRCEHRFYKSDGETLWVHSGVNPRKDFNGKVTLLWGLTLDITGFKTAELNQKFLAQASAILTSSLDYSEILKKVTHLIVPSLADWCTVDLTTTDGLLKRMAIAHNSPEKEQWVTHISDRYPLTRGNNSPILKVIETGEPLIWHEVPESKLATFAQDEDHLIALKELHIESVMVIPLKARSQVIGAVTFISNNPHRRFSEKDLNFGQELTWHITLAIENSKLYNGTKRAMELRDEMLGIVSHDLKGPLSAIGMSAQILRRGGKADPIVIGERISRSVERMDRLVSDLLTAAKIEAGSISIEKHHYQAKDLIQDTIDAISLSAETKFISVVREVSDSTIEVVCDRDRIIQVLLNLVGNAVKFTPDHGRITIGVKQEVHEIHFFISDTGPGISSEEMPHIFDRFWQTKEGKKVKESTGLGLFIAKKMIEAHQGKIWLESKVGQGATFHFTLPRLENRETTTAGAA
jgi:PAS domain S-box-containing protein